MWKNSSAMFILIHLLAINSYAGYKVDLGESKSIEFFQMIQLWSMYTTGAKDALGENIDDRIDAFIRRGRFGVKGLLHEKIYYKVWFAYDNLGKDPFSSVHGSPQDQSNAEFKIWDAFFTWRFNDNWANITMGYFRPQIGRESIVTAFKVSSFEKALTNSYPREHIVGRGPGRETGIDLGAFYHKDYLGFEYHLGFFDTNHDKISGSGPKWSPLFTGRVSFTLGEPEKNTSSIGYSENFYGKRNGATISGFFANQGKTNQTVNNEGVYTGGFKSNSLFGGDILVNFDYLTLTAEYNEMTRKFDRDFSQTAGLSSDKYSDFVYNIRAGWSIPIFTDYFIEPSIMYSKFEGDKNSAVYSTGTHSYFDFGINFYLKAHNLLINLHYVIHDGTQISKYSKSGEQRGDFIGMGAQYIF